MQSFGDNALNGKITLGEAIYETLNQNFIVKLDQKLRLKRK